MKLFEINTRIMKTIKNRNPFENYINHANPRSPHENHVSLKIIEIQLRITKIMKI